MSNIDTQAVVSEILATENKAIATVTNLNKGRMRSHLFGNFRLVILPKSDPDVGSATKWRKGANVEGTVYFVNPVHEVQRPDRFIFSMQSKDVRTLMRTIFSKVWEILYDYAVLLGDESFQLTYLKHRIKIHARWVDIHAKEFALHGKERDRNYVLHNATVEKKLRKRVEVLEA